MSDLNIDSADGKLAEIEVSHHSQHEALLNHAFCPDGEGRYLEHFPVWKLREGGPISQFGFFLGNRLAATAGLRSALLRMDQTIVRIGLIGAVATHSDFRGHGMAGQLLSALLGKASDDQLAAVFLWGVPSRLYQSFGFQLCGDQLRAPLSLIRVERSSRTCRIGCGWREDLFPVLKLRSEGLVQSTFEKQLIENTSGVQWFWTERNGVVSSYVAVGRGIDLHGMIHEWGGYPDDLGALLKYLQVSHSELQIIGTKALFDRYEVRLTDYVHESVAQVLVLDSKLLPNSEISRTVWFWGLDSC